MRDFPIIFSGPMVEALVAGRKTMTRRIVTPQNCEFGSISAGKMTKLYWEHANWRGAWKDPGFPNEQGRYNSGYLHVPCHDEDEDEDRGCELCFERGWAGTAHRLRPRVEPGDRMWVRENWARTSVAPIVESIDRPWIVYAAADNRTDYGGPWKPSIHMPRAASRITLTVTAVKIERLQEISNADIIAEGCGKHIGTPLVHGSVTELWNRREWQILWERINGADSWTADPYVVAITFIVHKQNIDTLPKAQAA